ncbi:MAG: hypothetical protein JWM92_576 [Candidatus Nomurabacteria bacterium]|nr:hypothetical protein [Candidatus Nomurabacteria bacterium]
MKLPLTIFKEGKQFVAYTPALDIATAGKTEKDARRMFRELVSVFMEEIITTGTAEEVLTELGWKKEQEKWNPPQLASSDFIDINIPAFA